MVIELKEPQELMAIPGLADALAMRRKHFTTLAQAWLEIGASAFELWERDVRLARWEGARLATEEKIEISASIRVDGMLLGELRVAGLNRLQDRTRLQAEAMWVSEVIRLELELETMTEALVNEQDQLLAMYDLSQSLRYTLSVRETLQILANEAARLVKAEGAFALLANPQGQLTIVLTYSPSTNKDLPGNETLIDIFRQMQDQKSEYLWTSPPILTSQSNHTQSIFVTPIIVQGNLLAGLGLINRVEGFTSPCLKLIRSIALQGGAQLENVQLYQETLTQATIKAELDVAANIQLRLLPQSFPQVLGLDFYARCKPALQVGGDFYDFIAKAGRPFIFALGDVTGKGAPAALLMAMTRAVVHNAARFMPDPKPAAILSRMNEDLYDDFTGVRMFATAFVGRYDPYKQQLQIANAGHSPVIYCPAGGPARLLEADGPPLGVLPDNLAENETFEFQPGDVLVVATDGFSEATSRHGELFGYKRLLQLVEAHAHQTAQQIADQLYEAVNSHESGTSQMDDQTLIIIKAV
jgi:phosphoserine phosphatase RsbU/P